MNADDIVNFYLQHSHSTQATPDSPSLCIATIESWVCIDMGGQVVIQGHINHHPRYPKGATVKTSPIKDHLTQKGRVYVTTTNSMYELGIPHPDFLGDTQQLVTPSTIQPKAQQTIWEVLESADLSDFEHQDPIQQDQGQRLVNPSAIQQAAQQTIWEVLESADLSDFEHQDPMQQNQGQRLVNPSAIQQAAQQTIWEVLESADLSDFE